MFVAFEDLLLAFELLVVLVLHANGAADVVDDVLVGRRGCRRPGLRRRRCTRTPSASTSPPVSAGLVSVCSALLVELRAPSGSRGRRCAIQIERRRGRRHALLVGDRSALAIEPGACGRGILSARRRIDGRLSWGFGLGLGLNLNLSLSP
jgi:hypothetical protein